MAAWLHAALQLAAEPVMVSAVHALPSSQDSGQWPSQVSGASTVWLPQLALQSLSVVALQAAGQQPSLLAHTEITVVVQMAVHAVALPSS